MTVPGDSATVTIPTVNFEGASEDGYNVIGEADPNSTIVITDSNGEIITSTPITISIPEDSSGDSSTPAGQDGISSLLPNTGESTNTLLSIGAALIGLLGGALVFKNRFKRKNK